MQLGCNFVSIFRAVAVQGACTLQTAETFRKQDTGALSDMVYRLLLQWQSQHFLNCTKWQLLIPVLSSNVACFLETSSHLVDFCSPLPICVGCRLMHNFHWAIFKFTYSNFSLFHCYDNLLAGRLLCPTSKNIHSLSLCLSSTAASQIAAITVLPS